jgi:chromatin remodeling complex protein RSC6
MSRKPATKEDEKKQKPQVKKEEKKQRTKKEETVVVPEETTTETVTKTRVIPTRESVEQEFDELIASIEDEISRLRESTSKSKGVKYLRTVNKRAKTLKTHALRVCKQKPTVRRNNTNSGFLKPVGISEELAEFTGWDHDQLRSRVDVTKFICNHIKQANLQDPTDRRKIMIEKDPRLKKLLSFDGKDGKPLTYYTLQTYLKNHFTPSNSTSKLPASQAVSSPVQVTEQVVKSPPVLAKTKKQQTRKN